MAAAINQQQQQAQPAQAVAVAGGGGGGEEEEDLNAQIREAVMAGDEAKAFRLVSSSSGQDEEARWLQGHSPGGPCVGGGLLTPVCPVAICGAMTMQAMQKILTTAIEDANSSRRRCILVQVSRSPGGRRPEVHACMHAAATSRRGMPCRGAE